MLSRMTAAYEFALSTTRDDSTLDARMVAVNDNARLFFKYMIPMWPMRQLINKIVRWFAKPFMLPQVRFNEAVRDVLHEMLQAQHRQVVVQGETLSMVAELELQIETLNGQVTALRQALALAQAANPGATAAVSTSLSPTPVAPTYVTNVTNVTNGTAL
jgi:hypothetical protein